MTAQEIAERFAAGAVTPERLQKLDALCVRAKVARAEVLALLPPTVQAAVAEVAHG